MSESNPTAMEQLPADAIVIYNHDWNGAFAWVGADDIIVRHLTAAEHRALDVWALVVRHTALDPMTPKRLQRYLGASS